jgi:aminoglycoside phosphotransferase (APT) family kinase protein
VKRDAYLAASLGHGDIVKSNVVVAGDRPVLIDWEHARKMPVARDLAKPLLEAPDPLGALDIVHRERLDLTVRAESYGLVEQLALAHVEMLTWTDHRRARARSAGRLDAFDRQLDRRTTLLGTLLDAA